MIVSPPRPSRRLAWLSGLCVGVGLCCWQGYQLTTRYQAKRDAIAAQGQGRESAKNMEALLKQLHDGPYTFFPHDEAICRDEDPLFGIDEAEQWHLGDAPVTRGSSSSSMSADNEGLANDGHDFLDAAGNGSLAWSSGTPSGVAVSPGAPASLGGRHHSVKNTCAIPQSSPLPEAPIGDHTSGESSGFTHSPAVPSSPQPNSSEVSSPTATTGTGKHHRKKRGRAVKAILHGVVAVLSSSGEDEREVEKVEVQQAAMNISSMSFLHWAVGNRTESIQPNRSATAVARGFTSPSPPSVYVPSTVASPQSECLAPPSPRGGLHHTGEAHTAGGGHHHHTRYPSHVSVPPGLPGGGVGYGDEAVSGTPEPAATRRSRHRRPWWRRFLRLARRTGARAWHRLFLPLVARPVVAVWGGLRAVCVAVYEATVHMHHSVWQYLVCARRRRSSGSTLSTPTKSTDPVDAFLEADGAVDVEEAFQEIVNLLKPSPQHPARVPTVAVIRVPIGYDASLETERLLAALQLDSSSREDGLVDLFVIEELKTASLPAQASADSFTLTSPTIALQPVEESGSGTLWARRQSTPVVQTAGTSCTNLSATAVASSFTERGTAHTAEASAPTCHSSTSVPQDKGVPLASTPPPPPPQQDVPTGVGEGSAESEVTVEDPTSRLKLTYEVYPASVFYAFLLRSALFQLKDDLTREAAAKVFGGDHTSALAPETSTSTGVPPTRTVSGTGDGWGSPTATPYVTCVSPMCAPYPAPAPPTQFRGHAHVSSLTLTSPSSKVFGAGAGPVTSDDSSPPSPASPRGARGASMVFFDATESFQALNLATGATGSLAANAPAGGPLPELSGSPLRRTGRPDATRVSGFSRAGGATSSSMTERTFVPSVTHPGFLQTHRQHSSLLRRSDEEDWCVCAMTVHVRSTQTVEREQATNRSGCTPSPLPQLTAFVGPFALPPSVVAPRALQVTQPVSADRHPASAATTPPSLLPTSHPSTLWPGGSPSLFPTGMPSGRTLSSSTAARGATAMLEEPELRVRYRTCLVAAGTHSQAALEKIDQLMARVRTQWWEVLCPLMQECATPAPSNQPTQAPTRSLSLREFFDISPRLRPWTPQLKVAVPPHTSPRHAPSPSLPPRAPTSPLLPRPRLSHFSAVATPLMSPTPDGRHFTVGPSAAADRGKSAGHTRDGRESAALHMPAWALNSVLRRESMRETLMKELKERAFRILSIPLPDARVYRQLPPDVPRYIAAHARGFALAHSFAQEILNQQRHLQHILVGLERRRLQLQQRQQSRQRRRMEGWQTLNGLFTFDKSQSATEAHKSIDGDKQHCEAAAMADAAGAPEELAPASTSDVSDAGHHASSCEDDTAPKPLDETRRGTSRAVSSCDSAVSLLTYEAVEEESVAHPTTMTGNPPADDGGASSSGTAPPAVISSGQSQAPVLVHSPAAAWSTPLALTPAEGALPAYTSPPPETARDDSASALAAVANAMTVASAIPGVVTVADASTSFTSGSGGATSSVGVDSAKRQGWTTTNTSTNYNTDGRSASPCVGVAGQATTPHGTAVGGSSPYVATLSPLACSTNTLPEQTLPTSLLPMVPLTGKNGLARDSLTTPPLYRGASQGASTFNTASSKQMDMTEVLSPASSHARGGGTWTPASSFHGDEDAARRGQRVTPMAPNNSMYGTFDAYFGQSIAAPQAVLMRHQAAGLRHGDAKAGGNAAGPARAGGLRLVDVPGYGASEDGSNGALTAPSSYTALPHSGVGRGDHVANSGAAHAAPSVQKRYSSAAVLPYSYSNDSVTDMLGTNHYPIYPATRENTQGRFAHHRRSDSNPYGPAPDRLLQYRDDLHDLLGSGGGAMSSGVTFYYTFGNATASLYNSCLRPTPERDHWDRVVSIGQRTSTAASAPTPAPSSTADGFGSPGAGPLPRARNASMPTPPPSFAPSPPPGSADDGASSYLFMEPDELDSSDEIVEEQTILRQCRNEAFYSVFRHLHRVFVDTVTTDAAAPPIVVSPAAHRFGPSVPPSRPGGAAPRTTPAATALPTLPPDLQAETVTLGSRTVARDALDVHNGHYGLEPLQLWLAARYSRRFAAEVYIMDVAACKSDRHYPAARVIDEVVEHAVLYYHSRRFSEFVEDLNTHFQLEYTPKTRWGRFTLGMALDEEDEPHVVEDPDKRDYTAADNVPHRTTVVSSMLDDAPPLSAAARLAVEKQRRCGSVCGKSQQEDESLFFSAFESGDAALHDDTHDDRLLLRELDHVKEFLLEHALVLCSALQTDVGANSLEEVFGVPATVFAFILCARESVALMDTVYQSIEEHYGRMTLENFSHFMRDVFGHDRPHTVRHATRTFRVLDKSRRGFFEYDELCWYMARKLSCGNNIVPDAHLLATAMSLRLPLILTVDQKFRWPDLVCTLTSLSDGEVEY